MKIRENRMDEGGEEDWWRKIPGYISTLCDNGNHCRSGTNNDDIRESILYAKLFEIIHSGISPLAEFFDTSTNYAEFKQMCTKNPAAKKACISAYRLLKSIEKN